MRRLDLQHKLALLAAITCVGLSASAIGCSSTPTPVDPPLDADPPLGSEPSSTAKSNPELDKGVALVRGEKFEEAIPHLKSALEADPKNAEASFYLGVSLEQTGKREEAEKLYKQAIVLDDKLIEAAQNLAALYLDEPPRPDQAIPLLEKALGTDPGNAKLQANLGYAYGLKGNVDKASKAYEAALAKEDSAQLRFAYGTMLFENKKAELAVPHLRKAAEGMKDDAPTLATIARMMGYGKAFDDCVKLLDRAIAQGPQAGGPGAPGQPDPAKAADPKAKAASAELFVRRGVCKHELNDEKGASGDFEAALKIEPSFQAAHYYLGLSAIAQGNKQKGRKSLQKAYDLGKETSIGKLAKEKLDPKK